MGTTVSPSVKLRTETSGPVHKFFDDNARAALTEGLVLDHGADGGLCFLHRLRNDDTLAERQTVRLDDDGRALRVNIGTARRPRR